MLYLKSIKLKYDERHIELFSFRGYYEQWNHSQIGFHKKFLREEKTAASNHKQGGIQIENTALSKGSQVVVHFFAKTKEKYESSVLKQQTSLRSAPFSCKRECSNTCPFFDIKSKQRQIHTKYIMNKYIKINKERRICGSVSRAGGSWYKHRADQHSKSFVPR